MKYLIVFIIGMVFGAFLLFCLAALAVESDAEEREEKWWRK